MLRLLVLLAAVVLVVLIVRKLVSGARKAASPPPAASESEAKLVRCVECGAFVPKGEALAVTNGFRCGSGCAGGNA